VGEKERGGWQWEVDVEADKEAVELAKVREEGRGCDVASNSEAREVLDGVDYGHELASSKKPFAFTSGERRLQLRLRPRFSRRHAMNATALGLGR
jgi:hypothetical protein